MCRIFETGQASTISSPATVVTNHILSRPLPAQILLSTSSLSRDIDLGYGSPTSETVRLMLEGIRTLTEQIRKPGGVCDDSILAVLNLWIYEAVLIVGAPHRLPGRTASPDEMSRRSEKGNIPTHINGLQHSIKCLGGVRSLSSETLWLLAW